MFSCDDRHDELLEASRSRNHNCPFTDPISHYALEARLIINAILQCCSIILPKYSAKIDTTLSRWMRHQLIVSYFIDILYNIALENKILFSYLQLCQFIFPARPMLACSCRKKIVFHSPVTRTAIYF